MKKTPEEQTNSLYEKKKIHWVEKSMGYPEMHLGGTLWTPKERRKELFPLILIAPGFFADENQEIVQSVADCLVGDLGVATFTMNYDNSDAGGYVLGHAHALDSTINELKRSAKNIDKEKIGLLGISYGGSIALLTEEKCKGIICLAPPVNPFSILEKPYFQTFSRPAEDGGKVVGLRGVHIPPVFDHPPKSLGQLEPKCINDEMLLKRYSTIPFPVVLIHAEGEKVMIPAEESRRIFDAVPNGSVFILEKPNSLMGSAQIHNFMGSLREPMLMIVKDAVQNIVINNNIQWLQKHL